MDLKQLIADWNRGCRGSMVRAFETAPETFLVSDKLASCPVLYQGRVLAVRELEAFVRTGSLALTAGLEAWYTDPSGVHLNPMTSYLLKVVFAKRIPLQQRLTRVGANAVVCVRPRLTPDDVYWIGNETRQFDRQEFSTLLAEIRKRVTASVSFEHFGRHKTYTDIIRELTS